METILIVDDKEEIRELLIDIVRTVRPDAVIISAEHGAHAWEIINAPGKKCHLVISDTNMPHMDGVELTANIRKDHPDVRVILMSGRGEPRGHEAHAFVDKPFNIADLRKTIEDLMRG